MKQAHKLLGITNQLADELEEIFNHWSKIKITDRAVKDLVQLAMAPNRETLVSLRNGKNDELSSAYNNVVSSVLECSLTSSTQQEVTTNGTLLGA